MDMDLELERDQGEFRKGDDEDEADYAQEQRSPPQNKEPARDFTMEDSAEIY